MYLIARPKIQAEKLVNLLVANGIKAKYLPVIDTCLNESILPTIASRLSVCQGILFTSPTSIYYCMGRLNQLIQSFHLYTVGESSAFYLQSLNSHKDVNYPRNSSGINALINENILVKDNINSLAVIGSGTIKTNFADYLHTVKINYDFIQLYQSVNVGLENLETIRLALNDNSLAGIIITSVGIAKYLINCAEKLNLIHKLKDINFISIHPQISIFLQSQGYTKLQQTIRADNAAILTLLGGRV